MARHKLWLSANGFGVCCAPRCTYVGDGQVLLHSYPGCLQPSSKMQARLNDCCLLKCWCGILRMFADWFPQQGMWFFWSFGGILDAFYGGSNIAPACPELCYVRLVAEM